MRKKISLLFQRYLRWSFLSTLIGILAGLAAAIFLLTLAWATEYRDAHPILILFLPLGGLIIGLAYHYQGKGAEGGTGLILEEIHQPKNTLPLRMAPLVLWGTIVTHLFGGSAGREGTAVQMGASLADQLPRLFSIEKEERKILLVAGAGAGFSAAIGAPLAGALFGLEVVQIGKLRLFALFECLVAAFVAYYTCQLAGAKHTHFPLVAAPAYTFAPLASTVFAGILFGLAANAFMKAVHLLEKFQKKWVPYPPLRPFFAGLLLVGLYGAFHTLRYAGLGLNVIVDSFSKPSPLADPFLKGGFTALTIGSGFKGGEFVPLVFIGSTLGSFLSSYLPLSLPLLCALGFAAVFGAAANTPLSCAVMAAELFGWKAGPWALVACWIAYFFTGHAGVYKKQPVARSKRDQLLHLFSWRKRS